MMTHLPLHSPHLFYLRIFLLALAAQIAKIVLQRLEELLGLLGAGVAAPHERHRRRFRTQTCTRLEFTTRNFDKSSISGMRQTLDSSSFSRLSFTSRLRCRLHSMLCNHFHRFYYTRKYEKTAISIFLA